MRGRGVVGGGTHHRLFSSFGGLAFSPTPHPPGGDRTLEREVRSQLLVGGGQGHFRSGERTKKGHSRDPRKNPTRAARALGTFQTGKSRTEHAGSV